MYSVLKFVFLCYRIEAENNSLKIDLEAAEEQLQKYSQYDFFLRVPCDLF